MGHCEHTAGLQRLSMSSAPQPYTQGSSRRSLAAVKRTLSAARGATGVLLTTVILRMHSTTGQSLASSQAPDKRKNSSSNLCELPHNHTIVAAGGQNLSTLGGI